MFLSQKPVFLIWTIRVQALNQKDIKVRALVNTKRSIFERDLSSELSPSNGNQRKDSTDCDRSIVRFPQNTTGATLQEHFLPTYTF